MVAGSTSLPLRDNIAALLPSVGLSIQSQGPFSPLNIDKNVLFFR